MDAAQVKVIVVTRFNVVFTEEHFSRDKAGSPTRTEAWLSRRFELFEQICLPSLMAQTDRHFVWMVFFSDGTPPAYMERIRSIQACFPAFRPVYLRDGEYMVGRFKHEVAAMLTPADTHVITTRIDNDDAFHREMIARVRGEWHGQDDEIINFLNGLQCDLDAGVVALAKEQSNPFISRIERVKPEGPRTVLEVMHFQAQGSGALRDVDASPLWLQLIHGGNVTNRLDSGRFLFHVDLARDYGIARPFRTDRWRTLQLVVRHWCWVMPRGVAARLLAPFR